MGASCSATFSAQANNLSKWTLLAANNDSRLKQLEPYLRSELSVMVRKTEGMARTQVLHGVYLGTGQTQDKLYFLFSTSQGFNPILAEDMRAFAPENTHSQIP